MYLVGFALYFFYKILIAIEDMELLIYAFYNVEPAYKATNEPGNTLLVATIVHK